MELVPSMQKFGMAIMGMVNFVVPDKGMYEIRPMNWVKVPLYVWIFYFDATGFLICEFSLLGVMFNLTY
jgi:hypothetical protein